MSFLPVEIAGESMCHFLGDHDIRVIYVNLKLNSDQRIFQTDVGNYPKDGGTIVQCREER
jgi:hypothetical protein